MKTTIGRITGKPRNRTEYSRGRWRALVDARRGMAPQQQRRALVVSMNAGADMSWIEGYVDGLRELGRSAP